MASIITSKLRLLCARIFKDSFADASRNYYLFIGKPSPWDDENSPDIPLDSVGQAIDVWGDMLSLKKIISSDVSLVCLKNEWDATGNTIYVAYDDQDEFRFEHPTPSEITAADVDGTYTAGSMYVTTDELNVYKCISNNNGAKSAIKPSGTSTNIIETGDGYRWKFLFTVPNTDVEKFVNANWVSVKTLKSDDGTSQWLVQQAAIDGAIESVVVSAGGSGYVNTTTGTAIAGNTNTITLENAASAVDNTYNDSTVYITGGTGQGQARKIQSYTGTTRITTVESNWVTPPDATSTYSITPSVNITGNGTGFEAITSVNAGAVSGITVISPGSGYTNATLTIEGGGGVNAIARAIFSPKGGHGSDPEGELGAYNVMVNSKLTYQEGAGDFTLDNDYRRIGLVSNVTDYGTTNLSSAATLNSLFSLTLSSVSGAFDPDEAITFSGGASAKVVQYIDLGGGGATVTFYQDDSTGFDAINTFETVTGSTSGSTGTIDSIVPPEVEPLSGDVIYLSHQKQTNRDVNQLEDFKFLVNY